MREQLLSLGRSHSHGNPNNMKVSKRLKHDKKIIFIILLLLTFFLDDPVVLCYTTVTVRITLVMIIKTISRCWLLDGFAFVFFQICVYLYFFPTYFFVSSFKQNSFFLLHQPGLLLCCQRLHFCSSFSHTCKFYVKSSPPIMYHVIYLSLPRSSRSSRSST